MEVIYVDLSILHKVKIIVVNKKLNIYFSLNKKYY